MKKILISPVSIVFVVAISAFAFGIFMGNKPNDLITEVENNTVGVKPSNTPTSKKPTVTPTKIPTAIKTKTPPQTKLPVLNGGNIFNYLNAYRLANGVPFLSVSNELCSYAEKRADYMMANSRANFKSSETNSHTGLSDAVSGYSGNMVGENLAMNVADDKDTIDFWKTSPDHNSLMLITEKDGFLMTKGCVATRVTEDGSMVVLLVGDK